MNLEGCNLKMFSGDTEICDLQNVEATVEIDAPEIPQRWEPMEFKGEANAAVLHQKFRLKLFSAKLNNTNWNTLEMLKK